MGYKNGNGVKNGSGPMSLEEQERVVLVQLAEIFDYAMTLRQDGESEEAEKQLRGILETEPRLAEPRLELAHVALDRDDFEEAEEQARYAVSLLEAGGQWTREIDPPVLLAYAYNLLGEVLIASLEATEETVENRKAYVQAWNEAAGLFQKAAEHDGDDDRIAGNVARYRFIK